MPPTPFTLQPAQTGTCSFKSAGTFTYSDPTATSLQGTLTLTEPAAPDTLSLFTQPDRVIYASKLTLTGELSSKKAGMDVSVLATPCGRSTETKAATIQTTVGGEYTVGLRTARNTIYTVQTGTTKSSEVTVKVQPRLRLGRTGAHHYSLRVFAAQKFAGRYATFQRFNGIRWVFVKRVRLHSNSTNILPTVISSVAFRATIAPRARIRAILPQLQAGSCYLRARATSSAARHLAIHARNGHAPRPAGPVDRGAAGGSRAEDGLTWISWPGAVTARARRRSSG